MARKNIPIVLSKKIDDVCPRCKEKGKIRHRSDMEKHYQIKHPKISVPERFYSGPRDYNGKPLGPYTGKFQIGTRVKVLGFERMPALCHVCGKSRPEPEKMRYHYKKKHPLKIRPDASFFWLHNTLDEHIDDIRGKKGTVFDVTPAKWGGPNIPAIIHVRLDKPIQLKYYDQSAMSLCEIELKHLKPKIVDKDDE